MGEKAGQKMAAVREGRQREKSPATVAGVDFLGRGRGEESASKQASKVQGHTQGHA